MANINVRGLSDATKEALRVRAAQAGMSLEAFARKALQQALTEDGQPPRHLLEIAKKYFGAKHGIELEMPSRSTKRTPADFSSS